MGFISEDIRAKAVIVYGDEICREKTQLVLREVGLPSGILPVRDVIECGYVEETGFVWMKQKNKIEHRFEKLGKLASLGTEITAYVEKHKIKKLTGVKVRELMIWLGITGAHVEDPTSGKITFKSSTGLYRVFPASAFEIEKPEPIKETIDGKEARLVQE